MNQEFFMKESVPLKPLGFSSQVGDAVFHKNKEWRVMKKNTGFEPDLFCDFLLERPVRILGKEIRWREWFCVGSSPYPGHLG
jgi:hypothetical protein